MVTDKSLESSTFKFKLGLDVHGVLDALPGFFGFLTKALEK